MSVAESLIAIESQARRVQIDSAKMNPRQRRVFEAYLAMGEDRTLESLYGWCKDNGIVVSHITLKVWSSKYAWQPLIQQIDEHIATELGKILLPEHVERVKLDLACFQRLKLDFQKRVRDGEIEIDLEQYLKICKTEDMMTSKPSERNNSELTNNRVTVEIDKEDLAIAMAVSAARKHGLPLPPEVTEQMKNVTPVRAEAITD